MILYISIALIRSRGLTPLVRHHRPYAMPAPLAPPLPPTGLVAPTTEPSAISTHASCPPVGSAAVELPQIADPSGATPTQNGYPFTPLVSFTPAPLQPAAPTANPAISIALAPSGPLTHGPPDEGILCDNSSSQASSNSSPLDLSADFVANMQAAYRTLDMRRVPRIQPLQFPATADRTAATQLLIRSMRDAFSGIFDVADSTGTVTMDSPAWVSGWNAPLLKLTKTAINANLDDTHDLHRLVDDLFSQIQERLSSGSGGPAAFKILLTDFADYFNRAPRGAALETLQKFSVRTGTPFSSYLRALRVVVASNVEKGGPLAPSATMAVELARIRTAQQYPTLMPTLFPGDRATREKPYASVALMWTAFADLMHNTSPAINGDAFSSASQVSSSHAPPNINVPTASVTVPHRHNSRPSRPSHTVSNVSPVHSRRDPFRIDYGIWPFDDQDYEIVCTVTNHALHTKLSLWTPLLTEDARRQACVQYSGRCCNCGSSDHSLRWCPAPFANVFSLLNPEFVTHDADGSIFETWKQRIRNWHSRGSNRRPPGNGRRSASGNGNGNARPRHRGPTSAPQGNSTGHTHTSHVAAAPVQPSALPSIPNPGPASTAAPAMRYGPAYLGNNNPNARQPGTFQVQPSPTRPEDSAESVPLSTAPHHGYPPPVNTNTQVTYTGPTLRPCHLHHTSDPAVSARTDPLPGTIIQKCGGTRTRVTDMRVLCPPHARPTHGHAAPGRGSSRFSAGLVSLPAIHELPLDDSSGDADSKVDAHPPCPIRIGVCPQSQQPPDIGTPASQLTAVGHTQDCATTRTATVIPHHFLDAENAFLNKEEGPSHSLWAGCSEPSALTHNTNATADLSACYGTSVTLGQHKACPDRDDSERTRPVTTPSVPPSHDLSPSFVPLEHAYAAYDTSLTYISDDVVLFWHPPSTFSQWTLSPFTVDLVEYNCAEQFMMASKARLFGDDTALSAILATKDPREQKRLGRHVRLFDPELWHSECEHIVLHGNLAKFSQNEEMRLALIQTGDHRLAEASPHDTLWGIGLSARAPLPLTPGVAKTCWVRP